MTGKLIPPGTAPGFLILVLTLVSCQPNQQQPASKNTGGIPSPKQPNIILVLTDDQGYGDLGCHGHPFVKTPHLDRLYTQSVRFTDFHASPTCAPTRAALMSGQAPFKTGVTHTILERDRMALGTTTIAEVLREAGYRTGIFGKWHLGDDEPYQPENRGFEETFIHGAGGIGQSYAGSQSDAPGNSYFDPVIKHNGSFVQTRGFCTDVFFQQALGWVKDCAEKQQPFFAFIPTNAPHSPFVVEEKYLEMYASLGDQKTAAFYGMITNIDDNMGLLMEKLDEWELADNTLLIFMTDNGTAKGLPIYNAGMKGKKATIHEGGSRVPLFMRLPGDVPAAIDIDRLTRHYDLFPTLVEMSGARLPEGLDGRSLVPLLKDPQAAWEDRMTFFHQGRWGKKGAGPRWDKGHSDPDQAKYETFAVRNEKWRLVGKEALYNIGTDPGETDNVIEQHPEIAREMLAAYDAWWDEIRPLLVNEDAPLDVGKPFLDDFAKQKADRGIPEWNPPAL